MSGIVLLSGLSGGLLALMLGIAVLNLLTAPRLERVGPPARTPRVSILLPARNEARTLRSTLPRLLRLAYPRLEILVLDDQSEDATAAVVEELAGGDPRLRLLRGAPLPAGWLGKSWACHQLAGAARGEVLVFCDADVFVEPEALARTVARLEAAGAVTALPRQRFSGWADRAVVPLVAQLPVLALLPLRLVGATRSPSLSMANGQWLAFRREVYRRIGGHAAVRAEVVEDVALGRRVKAAGERLLPVLAPRLLSVRMYAGAAALREGFGKNLYPLLGGRPLPFAAALAAFALIGIYPWAAFLAGAAGAGIPLALLLALRCVDALCFRQGWASVALHPLGALLLPAVAMESWLAHRRGQARWKGRVLAPCPPPPGVPDGPGGVATREFNLTRGDR